MVVLEGIEPPLGTHLVRTVYKAVGASSYTIGPNLKNVYDYDCFLSEVNN